MPRSYFRTLPDLFERKAFGTDRHPPYPPAAIACFLGVLCFGEQQPDRGRFKSLRLLRVLIEGPAGEGRPMARFLPFLLAHGDLLERPDGSLYIEGWDELQEGNWQVAERMKRYRARPHGVTPEPIPVTPTVTVPTVTAPSRVVVEAKAVAGAGADTPAADEFPALAWLAAHHATLEPNGNGLHSHLCQLVEHHGITRVLEVFETLGVQNTARQYVFGASNQLDKVPVAPKVDPEEAEIARRRERERAAMERERQRREGLEALA